MTIVVAKSSNATLPALRTSTLAALPVHERIRARAVTVGRQLLRPPDYLESEEQQRHATIACVIPCYNEQDTIEHVLTALLAQTRLPDVIHVVVNNTDDDTIEIANQFRGRHRRTVKGVEFYTTVQVHDMGVNPDKKVGALNFGYNVCRGYDYILGVDGDTTLDRKAVESLELEMADDPRIGGLSAIYSVDYASVRGKLFAKFLVAGQRAQFAAFSMDNLLRGRNMAVLGGQCSLFSVKALEAVKMHYHQRDPWVRDSEVEDSLLSLQVKRVGYATKISASARAFVGGMDSMRALHAQQVKWNYGGIDLMWPGQRGNTKGQPLHPNLRLRWYENFSMLLNVVTRLAFIALLLAAVSIDAFVFSPVWLIPPVVAVLLNVKSAFSMHDKHPMDVAYAALGAPAEVYMWIRIGHFTAAWTQFLARVEKDNWSAQSDAEHGRGGLSYLWPLFVISTIIAVLVYAWTQQSVQLQAAILSVGWPLLYLVTITQTLFMARKLLRRTRGYRV